MAMLTNVFQDPQTQSSKRSDDSPGLWWDVLGHVQRRWELVCCCACEDEPDLALSVVAPFDVRESVFGQDDVIALQENATNGVGRPVLPIVGKPFLQAPPRRIPLVPSLLAANMKVRLDEPAIPIILAASGLTSASATPQLPRITSAQSSLACPSGHPLEAMGTKSSDGWACCARNDAGGCKSGITGFNQTIGLARFRCERCNYDLCQQCVDHRSRTAVVKSGPTSLGSMEHMPANIAAKIKLQRVVADFLRSAWNGLPCIYIHEDAGQRQDARYFLDKALVTLAIAAADASPDEASTPFYKCLVGDIRDVFTIDDGAATFPSKVLELCSLTEQALLLMICLNADKGSGPRKFCILAESAAGRDMFLDCMTVLVTYAQSKARLAREL